MCQVYINLYQAHCHDWIYFKCSLELVHNVWLQEYLHFYCDPPLYHGDVKPSNVFLDKNYLAKVIGAKLCHSLQSLLHVNQLCAFQQLAGGGLVHHCTSSGNTTPSSTPVNVKIQATPGKAHFCFLISDDWILSGLFMAFLIHSKIKNQFHEYCTAY